VRTGFVLGAVCIQGLLTEGLFTGGLCSFVEDSGAVVGDSGAVVTGLGVTVETVARSSFKLLPPAISCKRLLRSYLRVPSAVLRTAAMVAGWW
jgi:hypothetical protein